MNAIIDGLPEAEYRAMPGLSGTEVAKILDNPADLKWNRDNPREATASMSLGTLVHALVLGTDPHVTVSAFPDFRTKAAREWRDEAEASGLTVITRADLATAEAMRDAVMGNPIARQLLEAPGHSEVTVTGEHRGAALKGRIDRLPSAGPVIDLKTARAVDPHAMSRFIADYGTATQLAHYALLADRADEAPIVIAVRNTGRPAVAVYRLAPVTWHVALEATRRAWDIYADCIETGIWPDPHADGINELELATWAMDALEGIDEMEVS